MSTEPSITVPRHLTVFGQALKSISARLAHAVAYPWWGSTRPASPDDLSAVAADLNHALAQMEFQTRNLMEEVLTQPNARDAAIHRQVGRFEGAVIDPLLKAHALAQTLRGGRWDHPATLLRRGMTRLIEQLHARLEGIVEVLEHPVEAYRSRAHNLEGDVAMFTFDLTLSPPPEWEALAQWTERQQRTSPAKSQDFSLRIDIDLGDEAPKSPPPRGRSRLETSAPIVVQVNQEDALAREQADINKTLTSMIKLMGWFMLFESFDGD